MDHCLPGPLSVPDVRVLATPRTEQGHRLIRVERTTVADKARKLSVSEETIDGLLDRWIARTRCHRLCDARRELSLVDRLAARAGTEEGSDALGTGEAADVRGEDTVGAGLHPRALRLLLVEPVRSASRRWRPT